MKFQEAMKKLWGGCEATFFSSEQNLKKRVENLYRLSIERLDKIERGVAARPIFDGESWESLSREELVQKIAKTKRELETARDIILSPENRNDLLSYLEQQHNPTSESAATVIGNPRGFLAEHARASAGQGAATTEEYRSTASSNN